MENQGCSTQKSCSTEKTGACGDKSKCCPVTIFKGALVGGVVMFIWFSVSWMHLPWHKADMMSFANDTKAAAAITALAPQSGVYVLPKAGTDTAKTYAFVSVFSGGVQPGDMKHDMYKDFLLCLFGAALLTKVLKKRNAECCPIAGSMVIGLLVGAFSYLPNMIWFHFPVHYSLVGMADDVIAITLAGAAISASALKGMAGCCPVCKCSPCCCGKTGSCGDKSDKKGSCGG